MQISFFEEFPTEKNLAKLDLIKFPTKLYIASSSLKELSKIKRDIKKITKRVRTVYWPVLPKAAGYWISPFSGRRSLLKVLTELQNKKNKIPIMLDLEFPINPFLYMQPFFFANKKIIDDFIKKYGKNLYLCSASFKRLEKYEKDRARKIIMLYGRARKIKEAARKNYIAAFGCIAKGIFPLPILEPSELEKNLAEARKYDVEEVVIYRLGGLDKKYLAAIKKYV